MKRIQQLQKLEAAAGKPKQLVQDMPIAAGQ